MKGEDLCINIFEINFRKVIFWYIIDYRILLIEERFLIIRVFNCYFEVFFIIF